MSDSLSKLRYITIKLMVELVSLVATVLKCMFVPLSKWKLVVTGLTVVVTVVFVALLYRQHVVFGQSDRSEEITTSNYVQNVWWTTVVKEANEGLSRMRQSSPSTSLKNAQTVEALMKSYDSNFETEITADSSRFGGIARVREADQKYPRAKFLKMMLDKGFLIQDATDYKDVLTLRVNLLSAERFFLDADTDSKYFWMNALGLPMDASWEACKEVKIQNYLEIFYYTKQARKDPILAQQWTEGIYSGLAKANDGSRFPIRADTTYFQLNADGSIGNELYPAVGRSDDDYSAIWKHVYTPFPFTEKLPKNVKIGFIGPDGKPADAPRRGMAKLWDGFADIFDDDSPEIARSQSSAVFPIQSEVQPVKASEPKPVFRALPDTVEANRPPADDSKPQPKPRHTVPELEMPDFPADLEQPEPASVIPSEIENQMKQVEDWKFPDGVEAEELERFLESLEDIDDSTSISDVPDNSEILREDGRYKERGDPNGNRDESNEEKDESERERREPPDMEP